jgi:GNAT superfamily N-acetyltransferase
MITYRTGASSDAAIIAQLHTLSWQTAYRGILSDAYLDDAIHADRLQFWQERLAVADSNRFISLAMDGTEYVGFVCVLGNDDVQFGALVDNLHVVPQAKGQGIGRELMRQAAQYLIQTAPPQLGMYLWVYEANVAARQFYERVGGIFIDKKEHDNPGGGKAFAMRYVWEDCRVLL